jgi:hypothetical protein
MMWNRGDVEKQFLQHEECGSNAGAAEVRLGGYAASARQPSRVGERSPA